MKNYLILILLFVISCKKKATEPDSIQNPNSSYYLSETQSINQDGFIIKRFISYNDSKKPNFIEYKYDDNVKVYIEYKDDKIFTIKSVAEAEGTEIINFSWKSNFECDFLSTLTNNFNEKYSHKGTIKFNANGNITFIDYFNFQYNYEYDSKGNLSKINYSSKNVSYILTSSINKSNPYNNNLQIWSTLGVFGIVDLFEVNNFSSYSKLDEKGNPTYQSKFFEPVYDANENLIKIKKETNELNSKINFSNNNSYNFIVLK